jgi:two-component system chemotaxis response regulator CheB
MARDIVVVGGSAGALQPLAQILAGLPGDFPASIFVVIHTSPETPGMLPSLLGKRTALSVAFATHDEPIRPGAVYVAPPDHHMLLAAGRVCLTRGPRENGFRPAVDPVFRTAATHYGARVVGVILSGGLDDGTRGLACIKEAGGASVVQRVEEASATGMPASAIRHVAIDHVLPAADIAPLLVRLAADLAPEESIAMPSQASEPDRAARGLHALKDGTYPGPACGFTCPECGGALWEITNGTLARFACHVGHSYTPDSLATGMAGTLEAALWTALRALEEHAAFFRRMADRASARNLPAIADGYGHKARDVEDRAEIVRRALVDVGPPPEVARPGPEMGD